MNHRALQASIAALTLMGLNAAHASDGTIQFTGEVTTSTCKVDAADANQTVALPKASTSQLSSPGAVTGRVGFSMRVTGCTLDAAGPGPVAPVQRVSVAFEPGPNVNTVTGRLKPIAGTAAAPAASGVEIALLNDQQEHIFIGASPTTSKSQFVPIDTATTGEATLNFSAEYVASSATVTSGTMNSAVTYSLVYQ